MLFVNYWDSSLGVCPVKPDGVIAEKVYLQAPAKVHAGGLADHLANRQSEPHAHAIVLDPVWGRIALVPDLGLIAAAIPVRRLRILLSAAAALIAATPVTAPPTAAGSRCTIGVLSTCT